MVQISVQPKGSIGVYYNHNYSNNNESHSRAIDCVRPPHFCDRHNCLHFNLFLIVLDVLIPIVLFITITHPPPFAATIVVN